MGAVPFFASFLGTAIVVLLCAIVASMAVAFFLPSRSAKAARMLVEWATAMSGAGFIALLLAWQQIATVAARAVVPSPALFGAVIALSYLPICVMLFLRAFEPQWPVLLASRTLPLSPTLTGVTIFRSAQADLQDALGLYTARLLADGAALVLVLYGMRTLIPAAILSLAAMYLLQKRLYRLVERTGMVAYPPLFGPLPELPPRLRMAPRVTVAGKVVFQFSVLMLVVVAVLEFSGLGIIQGWVAASNIWHNHATEPTIAAVALALQNIVPLLALTCILAWLWLSGNRMWRNRLMVPLAAVSPILFAMPGVLILNSHSLVGQTVAALGLVAFTVIQYTAACTIQAEVYRNTLTPGENTPAAAIRALALPPSAQAGPGPSASEAMSAAATWFGAVALLAVVSPVQAPYTAACALIWGLMAGVLQFIALWLRSTRPSTLPRIAPLSATLEALSHDTA